MLTESAQRLAKWFTTLSPKDKAKIIKDVSQLVLARRTRMCNFLEYKGSVSLTTVTHPLGLPSGGARSPKRRRSYVSTTSPAPAILLRFLTAS